MSTIICAKTSGNNRLSHIVETKEHHVKECVILNLLTIKWVQSKNQLADIFNKPLAYEAHERLTKLIMNDI